MRVSSTVHSAILIFLSIFFASHSYADQPPVSDTLILKSATTQTPLIELYTSEGCSSCPPADKWLGQLKQSDSLWSGFIPIAFHVDYWNYLGWKDRYAKESFSQRQYRYKQLGQVSEVYTPGMFLNAQEWQQWRRTSHNSLETALRINNGRNVGALEVRYNVKSSSVTFAPMDERIEKPDYFYLALLGTDIVSPIKAGENGGKRLHHDFVVLDLVKAPARSEGARYSAQLPTFNTELTAPHYAIAAWASFDNDSKPLQAVGGWLNASTQ